MFEIYLGASLHSVADIKSKAIHNAYKIARFSASQVIVFDKVDEKIVLIFNSTY